MEAQLRLVQQGEAAGSYGGREAEDGAQHLLLAGTGFGNVYRLNIGAAKFTRRQVQEVQPTQESKGLDDVEIPSHILK